MNVTLYTLFIEIWLEKIKLLSCFVVLADEIVDFSIEVKVFLTIVWFAQEDLQKSENFMSTSSPQPIKTNRSPLFNKKTHLNPYKPSEACSTNSIIPHPKPVQKQSKNKITSGFRLVELSSLQSNWRVLPATY